MIEFATCTLPAITRKGGEKMKVYKTFKRDLVILIGLIVMWLILGGTIPTLQIFK